MALNDSLTAFRWWRPQELNWLQWISASPIEEFGHGDEFKAEAHETRWLTSLNGLLVAERHAPTALYSPLVEAPALYRKFSDLEDSESAYLDFARTHGPLGIHVPLYSDESDDGEAFAVWRSERRTLKSAILVHEALRNNRLNTLSNWIEIVGERAHFVGEPIPGHKIGYRRSILQPGVHVIPGAWTTADRPTRLRRAAMLWVAAQIDRRLHGSQFSRTAVSATVLQDVLEGAFGVRIRPQSLLGALWLQFAQAIEAKARERQCSECKDWMLLSPKEGGKRRQALFCSAVCRLRHWREADRQRKSRKVRTARRTRVRRMTRRKAR